MSLTTRRRSGRSRRRAASVSTMGRLRDLRVRSRDFDVAALSPRIASAVFLVAGILGLCVNALTPAAAGATAVPAGLAAVGFGLVGVFAPWPRWDRRAQLAIPFAAFTIIAAGGLHGDVAGAFLAILSLPFVFVGFTQHRGTALAIAPFAALALVIGGRFHFTPLVIAALVFALPVSVFVGEAIAQVERRRARAERRIGRLLEAVRLLAAVPDEATGAVLVASLVSELLEADAVAVYLADRPGSGAFRNRASFGHPAVADAAPLVIDAKADPEPLRSTAATFVPDASSTPLLDAPGAAGRLRSAALLPLPGDDDQALGVVVAMWGAGLQRLSHNARQAAELLSAEAGHMFQRLQETAALAHDAETDPLTELANRRTFARALETLRGGDAVVIVDLDHFKSVNDRFGHQVGDRTLRTLARCLQRATRQVDCVARYGGEEFALVLPNSGAKGAQAVLDRVRSSWAAGGAVTTFSAGISVHEPDDDPHQTLRRADAALYCAKETGRDRDVLAPFGADVTM
jgi:diguanylate cyclase (GGDEF)-like protein